MSEEKREEMLDELLITARKLLKTAQSNTYKPSKYEISKVRQIIDTFSEVYKNQNEKAY